MARIGMARIGLAWLGLNRIGMARIGLIRIRMSHPGLFRSDRGTSVLRRGGPSASGALDATKRSVQNRGGFHSGVDGTAANASVGSEEFAPIRAVFALGQCKKGC